MVVAMSRKGFAFASSLCFCLVAKCNKKYQKLEVVSNW